MRFPEFTEEWKTVFIGDILNIGNGKDYKLLNPGCIPVFGTGGYMLSVDNFLYDGESVLIGRKGTINKPFYYSGKFWTVDTLFYTHSFNEVLPKFVYGLFQNINWNLYNEASGVPSLSKSTIEKIRCNIPTIKEQSKIANLLFLLDRRIETQNKIIEDLKKLKVAISNKLFELSNQVEYKISDIAQISRGRVISTLEISKQECPTYPVYSSQTSNNGIMGYLDTYDFEGEYITWTTDGANAGTVFYRNGKFNCTNVCGVLKVNDNIDAYYLSIVLQSATAKYVSTNLANPKLMNNTMSSIKVKLPSLPVQRNWSNTLREIDAKIENEILASNLLCIQKQYLLQQMFI